MENHDETLVEDPGETPAADTAEADLQETLVVDGATNPDGVNGEGHDDILVGNFTGVVDVARELLVTPDINVWAAPVVVEVEAADFTDDMRVGGSSPVVEGKPGSDAHPGVEEFARKAVGGVA